MCSGADVAVLVTGHTGFKGAWLALWLERLGATTFGIALPPPVDGAYVALRPAVDSERHCDIRDREGVFTLLDEWRPEVVFHLAAQALVPEGYRDPDRHLRDQRGRHGQRDLRRRLRRRAGRRGSDERQGLRQRRRRPSVHRVRPARWTRPVQRIEILRRHRCPLLAVARRQRGHCDGCCPCRQRDRRRRRRGRSPAARRVAGGSRRCPTPIAEPERDSALAVRRRAVARLPAPGGTAPHRPGRGPRGRQLRAATVVVPPGERGGGVGVRAAWQGNVGARRCRTPSGGGVAPPRCLARGARPRLVPDRRPRDAPSTGPSRGGRQNSPATTFGQSPSSSWRCSNGVRDPKSRSARATTLVQLLGALDEFAADPTNLRRAPVP